MEIIINPNKQSFQEITLYTDRKNCYATKLKKIFNCIANYVNVILEQKDTVKGVVNYIKFEGMENYDGGKHLLINILNQLNYLIDNDMHIAIIDKENNLAYIRDLIDELASKQEISDHTIKTIIKCLESAKTYLSIKHTDKDKKIGLVGELKKLRLKLRA